MKEHSVEETVNRKKEHATVHQNPLLNGSELVCFDLIKQSFSCLGGEKEAF